MWTKPSLFGMMCVIAALAANVHAATPVRAVGFVTEVWTKDNRYTAFYKELSDRFKDAPPIDVFMKDEQWVSVLVSTSNLYPVILKTRTKATDKVALGDVVELSVADNTDVSSYANTSMVSRVRCTTSAGTQLFKECVGAVEIGMWGADGAKISVKRK